VWWMAPKYSLFIDQALHLAILLALILLYRGKVAAHVWLSQPLALPPPPLAILTGFIYLLKPVSTMVNGFLQTFVVKKYSDKNTPNIKTHERSDGAPPFSFTHAGKYIGMLERSVAFILILYSQYTAIAFLMTAKTITRFNELNHRDIAEYYLIGTLLSIAFTLDVAMVCV